ncbi:alpha/beta-hydrolase [Lophiostoma macrostomum CBS 122681]|uniref:Alpha/beta-hydrolase n=1 Tax=Lophiostoma macrostomum CBS 122681 TaxID=1314788 RepID=A0A6A6T0F0_9PLEO|nr:alpha/beta-hydrolase [Lophiostoma macrostomum CBS 122681]
MPLHYLTAKLSLLPPLLQPTFDAIFSTLPLWCRWRLLVLQSLNFLVPIVTAPYWLFGNKYSVVYVPTRGGARRRCLVFRPPCVSTGRGGELGEGTERDVGGWWSEEEEGELTAGDGSVEARESYNTSKRARGGNELRPLHIDIHGGSFIGGIPEQNARWCTLLSSRTGAIVISCTYRFAPRYTFPAAHDDVDDILAWIMQHAEQIGGDRRLVTVGGSSAGGNLGLSAAVSWNSVGKRDRQGSVEERGAESKRIDDEAEDWDGEEDAEGMDIKAYLSHYSAIDLRLPPQSKPRPANFPARDPLAFMFPLYDIYAGANRSENLSNARLHPILSEKKALPKDMLFIVAGIDILVQEQLTFVERVRAEIERDGEEADRSVEARVFESGFHGWLELPKMILEKERVAAFEASVDFIRRVHRKHGWYYQPKGMR